MWLDTYLFHIWFLLFARRYIFPRAFVYKIYPPAWPFGGGTNLIIMGNANSGNIRDRHKSGDSLPPSSPCGMVKDGQAFSFDKRPSVGTPNVNNVSTMSSPSSSPATHLHSAHIQPPHHKIILQHSQSNEDDEPSYFTRQPISKSLSKDVSSVILTFL